MCKRMFGMCVSVCVWCVMMFVHCAVLPTPIPIPIHIHTSLQGETYYMYNHVNIYLDYHNVENEGQR